ncbi:hypothetical protein DB729_005535 [Streptococcus halitosis]|uniref:Uncharacterized protein n=1 Tax=Streptococcus halitosis TaxID=2172545 RepID=A0A426FYF5_9STRE|nr:MULTISPECIES: hypothetical protein [Streptococcus]NIB84225.1 hypothetical protein [Streptococcus sp. CCUG 71758]RRN47735.1 hypothetical protein DB729_005535 [Streptococcus halitosis]
MTAEIGILNKNGVVLASDSAVTLSDGKNSKVFNSARKLFTLSKEHSIGIMIYGNASFMEIPWEVILNEFKNTIGKNTLENTAQYVDELIRFLISFKHLQVEELLINYLVRSTKSILDKIAFEAQETADSRVSNGETISQDDFNNILLDSITNFKLEISEIKIEDGLEFFDAELDIIKEIVEDFFQTFPHTPSEVEIISKSLYKAIFIGYDSSNVTGLVIAGYGSKEIFPSIRQIELNGIFSQRLIWRVINESEINHHKNCHIIPFAQSEMVETIMNGIDPNLNVFIAEQISSVMEKRGLGDEIEKIFENISFIQQSYYINPIIDLIGMQPLNEMASTAKTFIELTSFKRKIVNTLETVGGPVDVLAISKGEGPVWIDRKYYFDIEKNIDYRMRKEN